MDDMARSLGMDVEQVKEANFYKKGDISYLVSIGCKKAQVAISRNVVFFL